MLVLAYTDGACSGNPGPGGWGVLLQAFRGSELIRERELCGGETQTTNNRMELTAAIEALQALKRPTEITIRTDSEYVRNGITSWIQGWKAKNWRRGKNQPVKNADLWKRLDELAGRHDVRWEWVKGHADNPGNERADRLANEGMDPYR